MLNPIEQAISALKAGQLIHLPTETVYGLAGRADDQDAVLKIFEAKGRPRFNPLIAHVSSPDMAGRIGVLDKRAHALIKAFWPGPLTLVVPFKTGVCDLARAGLDSIAIRMPAHPLATDVIAGFGGAVVAPSANRSGRPSPTTQADAFSETGTYVAVSLDGGPCHHGLESTVVSLIDETTSLLRPGSVTKAEIEAVIGGLTDNPDHGHRSPGRLSRHYAPDAPIKINIASPSEGSVYLAFGPTNYTGPCFNLSPTQDLAEAARHLFAYLRQADALKPDLISVAPIPDQGLGFAINDRLKRAAGFVG